jgi:predicted short-subunit dehydrogenase-like oxidoreductase (DUF2520 family)
MAWCQHYKTPRTSCRIGQWRGTASVILPTVRRQQNTSGPRTVTIVGAGNLGTALALILSFAGYKVKFIAVRRKSGGQSRAMALARKVKARLVEVGKQALDTDIVWLAVPDDSIAQVARTLASAHDWKGTIVFHSSGALTSDELAPLREKGARVATVHPMMTFVGDSAPNMRGVTFAVEGDRLATGAAREIVERLGGETFLIRKQNKVLYHAFGSFASPLVVALMASLEQVAEAAGVRRRDVKRVMLPLLLQTLRNYLYGDAASAFSGPLVRGDVATVRRHLQELTKVPEAREVYVALARAATRHLPVKNRTTLERELSSRLRLRDAWIGSMKDSMETVGDIISPANKEDESEALRD